MTATTIRLAWLALSLPAALLVSAFIRVGARDREWVTRPAGEMPDWRTYLPMRVWRVALWVWCISWALVILDALVGLL